jgi:hypothetical protein
MKAATGREQDSTRERDTWRGTGGAVPIGGYACGCLVPGPHRRAQTTRLVTIHHQTSSRQASGVGSGGEPGQFGLQLGRWRSCAHLAYGARVSRNCTRPPMKRSSRRVGRVRRQRAALVEESQQEPGLVFTPEFPRHGERQRARILHALGVASAWPAWSSLRDEPGLGVAEAASVLRLTLGALLRGWRPPLSGADSHYLRSAEGASCSLRSTAVRRPSPTGCAEPVQIGSGGVGAASAVFAASERGLHQLKAKRVDRGTASCTLTPWP